MTTQISTSVKQKTEDVVLMPSALTLWAVSTARVNQGTPEMDAHAQVNQLRTIVMWTCHLYIVAWKSSHCSYSFCVNICPYAPCTWKTILNDVQLASLCYPEIACDRLESCRVDVIQTSMSYQPRGRPKNFCCLFTTLKQVFDLSVLIHSKSEYFICVTFSSTFLSGNTFL